MADVAWYGKLPCAGDFVGRRLPQGFQSAWDQWLQNGIAHARQLHGARWEELYLTFPVWRFLLPAGAFGAGGWCGVLMPSVDRVGRHFPLTICESLAETTPAPGLRAIDAHLDQFAHAGLDALDGMTLEDFDHRLGALRPLRTDGEPEGVDLGPFLVDGQAGSWRLTEPLAQTLADSAERALLDRLGRRSLWWRPLAEGEPGEMRLEPLPLSVRLLDQLITSSDWVNP